MALVQFNAGEVISEFVRGLTDRQRETLRLLLTDEAWGQLLFQKLGGPLGDTSWDAKIASINNAARQR